MKSLRPTAGRLSYFFSSVRFRLTLYFVIILSIVLAAFSAFIYVSQSRDLRFDAVQNMQAKLSRLESYFGSPAWQNSDLPPAGVPGPNGEAVLQPGDFIVLATPDGQVVQDWGATLQNAAHVVGGLMSAAGQNRNYDVFQQTISVTDGTGTSSTTSYLFLVLPVTRHEVLLGFLILGSPSPLNDQLRRLTVSLFLGSLGMLALAFLGGLWLADRAMRPVGSITQAARIISETDLNRRLNLRGRDELAQLGSTFDSMLSRLQVAFERQRRFVADASHELRTPLTIINLEVGRVLTGNRRPAEYQRALQVVDLESTRMTRLVNDLMTLARMDAGQTILQSEELDLSEVAVDAYERMLPLAESRQIALDMGEMQELPIQGDRQYLIQMISNLIENAIKYSQPGGRARLETEALTSPESPLALLRVSDTGPGIPAEHIPHLFERFYRVDGSRPRDPVEDASSPTGTGLGLSIVAWIVEGHKARISVKSEPGKGTEFEVTFRLLERAPKRPSHQPARHPASP